MFCVRGCLECPVCAWCLWRSEEGIRAAGTEAVDGSELSCVCQEPNPGPL